MRGTAFPVSFFAHDTSATEPLGIVTWLVSNDASMPSATQRLTVITAPFESVWSAGSQSRPRFGNVSICLDVFTYYEASSA
jgi:hypothetical protein